MANRHTLAASHIEEFKHWLVADGYTLRETKTPYEVIRATKPDRKHIFFVHKRLDTEAGKQREHFTVADRDMGVVRAFLRNRRKQ